jgi:hypothetical protein
MVRHTASVVPLMDVSWVVVSLRKEYRQEWEDIEISMVVTSRQILPTTGARAHMKRQSSCR